MMTRAENLLRSTFAHASDRCQFVEVDANLLVGTPEAGTEKFILSESSLGGTWSLGRHGSGWLWRVVESYRCVNRWQMDQL
jgi:hypothetical protein